MSVTKILIGDRGISLLIIAGLFVVLALTVAPLSVYKPSDELLKDYLETTEWNYALLPMDFGGFSPEGSYGYVVTSQKPVKELETVEHDIRNYINEISERIENNNATLYSLVIPVTSIFVNNETKQPFIVNILVYNGSNPSDEVYIKSPDSNLTKLIGELFSGKWEANLTTSLPTSLEDAVNLYFKLFDYQSFEQMVVRNLENPNYGMQMYSSDIKVYGGSYTGPPSTGITGYSPVPYVNLYVPSTLNFSDIVSIVSTKYYFVGVVPPWKSGLPAYVALVKIDLSSIEFNPMSPETIMEKLIDIGKNVHGLLSDNIKSVLDDYSNLLQSFKIATSVVFLMFILGIFVIIPSTAGAMTGGIRRILFLLRLRGVRHRVVKRGLLKASLLAVLIGGITGIILLIIIVYIWIPKYADISLKNLYQDRFTLGSLIVSLLVTSILYWRKFTKHLSLEKIYTDDKEERKERGGRLAWFLLGLSIYHIARGYIGWSAISYLETSPDLSMLLMIVLIILGIIEFFTTIFTPVMLAYSISVIVMKNIDTLVKVVSRSRRFLGDVAIVAGGIGKLLTPSLIGLATILVFSLAVLFPAVSTGLMVESAAVNAVKMDVGAPYVFMSDAIDFIGNNSISSLVNHVREYCPGNECAILIMTNYHRLTNSIELNINNEELWFFSPDEFVVVTDPDAYSTIAFKDINAKVLGKDNLWEAISMLKNNDSIIYMLSPLHDYEWSKVSKLLETNGINGDICINVRIMTLHGPRIREGSCNSVGIKAVVSAFPGEGVTNSFYGGAVITGPWMINYLDEARVIYQNLTNMTGYLPFTLRIYVMSTQPFNLTGSRLSGSYITFDNITNAKTFDLWVKSIKFGIGSPSMKSTGFTLLGLLIILTVMLSYVSVRDVDRIYRLLRLRGINRRMTFTTLIAPWISIILVIGIIGLLSGIGINFIYRMTMLDPTTGFVSLSSVSYEYDILTIHLADGTINTHAMIAALPWMILLLLFIALIPFAYMYKVLRGTPAQTLREV